MDFILGTALGKDKNPKFPKFIWPLFTLFEPGNSLKFKLFKAGWKLYENFGGWLTPLLLGGLFRLILFIKIGDFSYYFWKGLYKFLS